MWPGTDIASLLSLAESDIRGLSPLFLGIFFSLALVWGLRAELLRRHPLSIAPTIPAPRPSSDFASLPRNTSRRLQFLIFLVLAFLGVYGVALLAVVLEVIRLSVTWSAAKFDEDPLR